MINEVFSPTDEEVRQATRLLEEFASAERDGRAALQLPNGEFVDYAFLQRPKRPSTARDGSACRTDELAGVTEDRSVRYRRIP